MEVSPTQLEGLNIIEAKLLGAVIKFNFRAQKIYL